MTKLLQTLVNSIAAQEAGSDFTEPYRVDAAGVAYSVRVASWTSTLDVSAARHRPAAIHAAPASGRFRAPIPADSIVLVRGDLTLDRPWSLLFGGIEARARGTLTGYLLRESPVDTGTGVRGSADLELQRPIRDARIVARTIAAGAAPSSRVPPQLGPYFGGPITAPGYAYHSLVGRGGIAERLELQFPIPFPSFSLGRFGRSAARATAAPFVTAVLVQRDVFPSAGVGLLTFFDIVRFDVARGLKPNGRWSFYVDISRAFWSVL